MRTIDLNCDLGEHEELADLDRRLVRLVTSANIACGGHAGDERSMERTIRACLEAGVAIGAHPSYPDRAGFGRTAMVMPAAELERSIGNQLAAFAAVAARLGAKVRHVKPHGALYHASMNDHATAQSVLRAVRAVLPDAALVALAGSRGLEWWRRRAGSPPNGVTVIGEAFAERSYEANGSLRSRLLDGAMISDPGAAALQAVEIAVHSRVRAIDGTVATVRADSICIHGDSPGAEAIARAVRSAIESSGVRVAAPTAG